MLRHLKVRSLTAATALVFTSALAFAQSAERGGVPFTSGGVGLEARQQMLAKASQYTLHLEFAEATDGEFVSGVEVTIASARGNLLSTRTDGPWLLAQLPPGSYTVTARYGGNVRQQQVSVGQGRRHLVMRFPQASDQVAGTFASSMR
jgi:hypothetical protein